MQVVNNLNSQNNLKSILFNWFPDVLLQISSKIVDSECFYPLMYQVIEKSTNYDQNTSLKNFKIKFRFFFLFYNLKFFSKSFNTYFIYISTEIEYPLTKNGNFTL